MSGGGHEHSAAEDVVHHTHGAHSLYEAIHGGLHLGKGAHGAAQGAHGAAQATGGLSGMLGPAMGGLGAFLGGYSLAEGVNNIVHGDYSQGVLDVASGGLGIGAGAAAMAGAACPPLAIAAGVAGLGSYGNKFAEEHGWYGTHTDENGNEVNSTFLGSIGERTSDTYNTVNEALGDNWFSKGVGGIAGGLAGAGQTVWNAGAAVTGGLARGGSAIISGIGSAGAAIISFLSDERLKTDVAVIDNPLDRLNSL